jgi:hypothetical protein
MSASAVLYIQRVADRLGISKGTTCLFWAYYSGRRLAEFLSIIAYSATLNVAPILFSAQGDQKEPTVHRPLRPFGSTGSPHGRHSCYAMCDMFLMIGLSAGPFRVRPDLTGLVLARVLRSGKPRNAQPLNACQTRPPQRLLNSRIPLVLIFPEADIAGVWRGRWAQ